MMKLDAGRENCEVNMLYTLWLKKNQATVTKLCGLHKVLLVLFF